MPGIQDPADTSSTIGNAPIISLKDSPAYVTAIEVLKYTYCLPLSKQIKLFGDVYVDDLPAGVFA